MKNWAVGVTKTKFVNLRDGLLYSGYLLLAAGLLVDALKCSYVRSDLFIDACEKLIENEPKEE